jgi:hypothetical protein
MTNCFFSSATVAGNLEQVVCLVDAGKLESGL